MRTLFPGTARQGRCAQQFGKAHDVCLAVAVVKQAIQGGFDPSAGGTVAMRTHL